MEKEWDTPTRVQKIFDMIAHFELYDARVKNTETYLMEPNSFMPFVNRDVVVREVAEKLRADTPAATALLESIIGDEMEGTLVLAKDEWIEAAIARIDEVARRMGTGVQTVHLPAPIEEIRRVATFTYLHEPYWLDRVFMVESTDYRDSYGVVCKVKVSEQAQAAHYLPSTALFVNTGDKQILRALTRLGFLSEINGKFNGKG